MREIIVDVRYRSASASVSQTHDLVLLCARCRSSAQNSQSLLVSAWIGRDACGSCTFWGVWTVRTLECGEGPRHLSDMRGSCRDPYPWYCSLSRMSRCLIAECDCPKTLVRLTSIKAAGKGSDDRAGESRLTIALGAVLCVLMGGSPIADRGFGKLF